MSNIFQRIKKEFQKLGPGFVTGAADDDPSGIATYSITGAQFGYKLTFMSWITIPMMIAIQETCARIGMLTGMGLAGVIKQYYSKKILYFTVTLLFVANTINIGTDLGVMAASIEMVTGINFFIWLILVTLITLLAEILIPYRIYAKILKFASFFLLVYLLTSFLVTPDWITVFKNLVTPYFSISREYFMAIVGFLGTSISPYLFFWQASEEVEDEIAAGKTGDFADKKPFVSGRELKMMRRDTDIGMVFSQIISFFIVITTASTLFANGIHDIETPNQAALALKPLAGNFTYLLFTVGIVGIGLQSIPVLAGSAAYAVSESLGVKEGLSKKFFQAKIFYLTIAVSTIIGLLINLLGINIIRALYYTAIINGVAAVPLIYLIMKLGSNEKVVGKNKPSAKIRFFGWAAFVLMFLAAVFMFLSIFGII